MSFRSVQRLNILGAVFVACVPLVLCAQTLSPDQIKALNDTRILAFLNTTDHSTSPAYQQEQRQLYADANEKLARNYYLLQIQIHDAADARFKQGGLSDEETKQLQNTRIAAANGEAILGEQWQQANRIQQIVHSDYEAEPTPGTVPGTLIFSSEPPRSSYFDPVKLGLPTKGFEPFENYKDADAAKKADIVRQNQEWARQTESALRELHVPGNDERMRELYMITHLDPELAAKGKDVYPLDNKVMVGGPWPQLPPLLPPWAAKSGEDFLAGQKSYLDALQSAYDELSDSKKLTPQQQAESLALLDADKAYVKFLETDGIKLLASLTQAESEADLNNLIEGGLKQVDAKFDEVEAKNKDLMAGLNQNEQSLKEMADLRKNLMDQYRQHLMQVGTQILTDAIKQSLAGRGGTAAGIVNAIGGGGGGGIGTGVSTVDGPTSDPNYPDGMAYAVQYNTGRGWVLVYGMPKAQAEQIVASGKAITGEAYVSRNKIVSSQRLGPGMKTGIQNLSGPTYY